MRLAKYMYHSIDPSIILLLLLLLLLLLYYMSFKLLNKMYLAQCIIPPVKTVCDKQ